MADRRKPRSRFRNDIPNLPQEFPGFAEDTLPPPTDELAYGVNTPPLGDTFKTAVERNRAGLGQAIGHHFEHLQQTLDGIYRIAGQFYPWMGEFMGAVVNPATRLIFSCFHAALVNTQSAAFMTENGLYGPARPIIRQAYEATVVGKYCAVVPEADVFDRWMDHDDVWIGRHIFPTFVSPTPTALKRHWKVMSLFTHSTAIAGQWNLRIKTEESLREVLTNITFVAMLCECLYHLLSRHLVTSSVRYYQEFFGDAEFVRELSRGVKHDMSTWRQKHMGRDAKRVVREYRAKWVISGGPGAA